MQFSQAVFRLPTHLVRQAQILLQLLVVLVQAHVLFVEALGVDGLGGVLCRKLVELALDHVNLAPQLVHSLVSVFLNFIDAHDLPLESLCLFEECLVHLLDLVTLQLILLFESLVLPQSQLKMLFLGLKAID